MPNTRCLCLIALLGLAFSSGLGAAVVCVEGCDFIFGASALAGAFAGTVAGATLEGTFAGGVAVAGATAFCTGVGEACAGA